MNNNDDNNRHLYGALLLSQNAPCKKMRRKKIVYKYTCKIKRFKPNKHRPRYTKVKNECILVGRNKNSVQNEIVLLLYNACI